MPESFLQKNKLLFAKIFSLLVAIAILLSEINKRNFQTIRNPFGIKDKTCPKIPSLS